MNDEAAKEAEKIKYKRYSISQRFILIKSKGEARRGRRSQRRRRAFVCLYF